MFRACYHRIFTNPTYREKQKKTNAELTSNDDQVNVKSNVCVC